MFEIDIPNFGHFAIEHLVCDYNGTLAVDGRMTNSTKFQLNRLAGLMQVHVVTADTFGTAAHNLRSVNCTLTILPSGNQSEAKRDYIHQLGPQRTAAIGNGGNDRLMLKAAALGIAVLMKEGSAVQAIQAADILCSTIDDALALFLEPKRLLATLRQ